jgi:2-keto-4-pentenoate hydratase/2-oxohepta-3-ene-1,7-dioic acid hydratase in catechol pathway
MKNLNSLRIPPGLDYPVRNIFCIGRNYADHAAELKNDIPSEPVVFLKPTSSMALGDEPIIIPEYSKNVHHEVEIVLAIKRRVKNESPAEVLSAIDAIAIGIDVTARDLQDQLKEKKLPWTIAKGLDTFAALSKFDKIKSPEKLDWSNIEIELLIDDVLKQKGKSDLMLFPIATLISFLSQRFTLDQGDLIYTGTPAGVGPLKQGNQLTARMKGVGSTIEWMTKVI